MFAVKLPRSLALLVVAGCLVLSPLMSSTKADAATCAPDPYNGVCLTPTYYKTQTTAKTAVQRTPKTGNVSRYVTAGGTVGIICQINDGGTVSGSTSRTWVALSGGGWVFSGNVPSLKVESDGFTSGLRRCGIGYTNPTPLNPAAYPWPTEDNWVLDGYGYYEGECTSFAAWAVRNDGRTHTKGIDFLGDASKWTAASADSIPHVGDVAQWDPGYNYAGSLGHVAYVGAVNTDGTVTVYDYNWPVRHRLATRVIPANNPSRYLHY